MAGPTCPVETVPPRRGCKPRPLAVTLQIHLLASPAVLEHSGIDGRFRVDLPPGTYVVQARRLDHLPYPRPPAPFDVRVRAGRFSPVTITHDTGIR